MLDEVLLYDLNDSPFCLKARIFLHLKGVPFRRVTLTPGRRRELRRLSPLGKVPVLVQDGSVVPDSSRIARHLENLHPDPALLPEDPAARAYATLLEEWADEALYFIVGAFKWLNPANRAAARQNTADELANGLLRPLAGWAIGRNVRRRYAAWGYGAHDVSHFQDRMRQNLRMLDQLVAGKPYLLGRGPTVADVAVFAQLAWMQRYAEAQLLDEVPDVADWVRRLGELTPVAAALSS